jgi:hypothetical protein
MTPHNAPDSNEELQRLSGQLGFSTLSPTSVIDPESDEFNPPTDDLDLDGAVDTQGKSRNPLVQYGVASALALGLIGIPLSLFFGVGGAPQVAKDIKPADKDKATPVADQQTEKLRTDLALNIQTQAAKPSPSPTTEPPPVATAQATPPPRTPQVAATPSAVTPVPQVSTTPPVVTPVVRQPVRQPVVQQPAAALQPIRSSNSYPIQPQISPLQSRRIARALAPDTATSKVRAIPKDKVAPATSQTTKVATNALAAKSPTAPAIAQQPIAQPISWEQASSLAGYGGLPQNAAAVDTSRNQGSQLQLTSQRNLSPTLALPVGVNVPGRTITPFTSISNRNNASRENNLSVVLDQAINLAQGYNLPVGTVVQFVATVADNGAITAISKGLYVDGVEIKIPPGAFMLTTANNGTLIANQRAVRRDELAGADANAAIWGAGGAVGKVLANAGNQTAISTTLTGATSIQSNNPNPNYLGAALDGAFSPLAQSQQTRANALANEINALSKINSIDPQTRVRIYVASPGVIQIPVAGNSTVEATAPSDDRPAPVRSLAMQAPPPPLFQPVIPAVQPPVPNLSPANQPVLGRSLAMQAPPPPLLQPVIPTVQPSALNLPTAQTSLRLSETLPSPAPVIQPVVPAPEAPLNYIPSSPPPLNPQQQGIFGN